MKDDVNLLFQQMGEVLSEVRGLHGIIDLRQAQADQLYDLVRSDLTVLRHEHRRLEEKFDRLIWLAHQDIETLRLRSASGDRCVQDLATSVDALQRPIDDIAALKARVAGLLFATGVFGSAALWLAEPLYRWLIENIFGRH